MAYEAGKILFIHTLPQKKSLRDGGVGTIKNILILRLQDPSYVD